MPAATTRLLTPEEIAEISTRLPDWEVVDNHHLRKRWKFDDFRQALGFALIVVFWAFESRRYRLTDVWYARVRKIEENFYGPILRRDPVSPEHEWGDLIAEDLFSPRFKISRMQALRARLLRNYWAIFLVQFIAWGIKLIVHPTPARSWADVRGHLDLGVIPWWGSLLFVGGVVLSLFGVVIFAGPRVDEQDHWTRHSKL